MAVTTVCMCVFLEMETMNGEVDDGKGGSDVVKEDFLPSECSETEPSVSEGIVGIADSLDCHGTDTKDLSTPDPEHFAEAPHSGTVVDDAIAADEASDAVDLTSASEIQSLHHVDENVPTDCVEDGTGSPAEPIDSTVDKMEDTSEPTEGDETESVAAASEDDGWMYVLGHDQLKKRARTPADFSFFFFSPNHFFSTLVIIALCQTV